MSKDFCLFCLYSSPLFSGILSRRDKKQTKRGKRGTSQRNICPQALLPLQCTLPSLCSRQQLCRVVLQCLHEPHLTSPHLTKLFPTVFLCCSFMLSFFSFWANATSVNPTLLTIEPCERTHQQLLTKQVKVVPNVAHTHKMKSVRALGI